MIVRAQVGDRVYGMHMALRVQCANVVVGLREGVKD